MPTIVTFQKQDWNFLLQYYKRRYKKNVKPVQRRNGKTIPVDVVCPVCDAPHHYIYDNNGGNGQYLCKICGSSFVTGENLTKSLKLKCPYCSHVLVPKKNRKHFIVHKCIHSKCSYYLQNPKKVSREDLKNNNKHKYKLHYIYRVFTIDFFSMD